MSSSSDRPFVCCPGDRKNRCDLDLKTLRITYDSADLLGCPEFPRMYGACERGGKLQLTVTHKLKETYPVQGQWIQTDCGWKINIYVELKCPVAEQNNQFCRKLSTVMQALAVAERPLLEKYPKYGKVPIEVCFAASEVCYRRTERWKCLEYWLCSDCKPCEKKSGKRSHTLSSDDESCPCKGK